MTAPGRAHPPAADDPFPTWSLPPGFDPGGLTTRRVETPWGAGLELLELGRDQAARLATHLEEVGSVALRSTEVASVVAAIDRAAGRLRDPDDPTRARALSMLPGTTGLPPETSADLVDRMAREWAADRLEELLYADFGDPGVLDGFHETTRGTRVHALGPSLTLHMAAGNVPGGSVGALITSLLVKSPTLLKPGAGDVVLPVLFHGLLADEAPDLASACAVVHWEGGRASAEEVLLERAAAVVVQGGADAVRAVRERRGSARVVEYGPRIGVAVLGRAALTAGEAEASARAAAEAVAAYAQAGCVSPRILWVERGGEVSPEEWASLLVSELQRVEERLPSGRPTPAEAAEIEQMRMDLELRAGAPGSEGVVSYRPGSPWTVLVSGTGDPSFASSLRTVCIHPVDAMGEAPLQAREFAPLLQTVAIRGVGSGSEALALEFARLGASRITTLEAMPWPRPSWRHDGTEPLRSLVRWVEIE